MKTIEIAVQKEFCGECSLALLHFLGKMPGIESVEAETGKILVRFDDAFLSEEKVTDLVRQNVEKMGYRLIDAKQSY